jgi:hypothetical protein
MLSLLYFITLKILGDLHRSQFLIMYYHKLFISLIIFGPKYFHENFVFRHL